LTEITADQFYSIGPGSQLKKQNTIFTESCKKVEDFIT